MPSVDAFAPPGQAPPTPQFARLPVELVKRARAQKVPGDALYVLVYLHSLVDHRTGALPKDAVYHHRDAAAWTGFSRSTVAAHLAALEQAGLLQTRRVFRGLRFRLLGLTTPPALSGKHQRSGTPARLSSSEVQIAGTKETLAPDVRPPKTGLSALPVDPEESENGGGPAAAEDRATPQAPPPQIHLYDEVFAPVRAAPLEPWRWNCITSVVEDDPRSLEGWRLACLRWLGNKQDPEKVVTLVTSYREKFQPKAAPGGGGPPPPDDLPRLEAPLERIPLPPRRAGTLQEKLAAFRGGHR